MSNILCNYFKQETRIKKSLKEVEGVVITLDNNSPHWDAIAMISKIVFKFKTFIFIPQGNLSIAQAAMVDSRCFNPSSCILATAVDVRWNLFQEI